MCPRSWRGRYRTPNDYHATTRTGVWMNGGLPSWLGTGRQRIRLIIGGMLAVGVFFLMGAAWTALVPFLLGALLAYLLLPLVDWLDAHMPRFLRRWRWSRPIAILVVYLVLLGLVGGMLTIFIPTVVEQGAYLIEAAPMLYTRIESLLSHDLVEWLERIPPEIQETVNSSLQRASATVLDAVEAGLGATIRTVSQTVSFVVGMVIVPFWLFYVLNDFARARAAFYRLIPEPAREDVRCVIVVIERLLNSYLRGQAILCLFVGGLATIVLVVFGVREALLLGTLAGILEAIPYLGPWLGAVVPVLIALGQDPVRALWMAVAFAAIQQVENSLVAPRVSGNAVRFHPAVIMVVVVVGAEVAGVWGLLLAVPVAASIRDVFRYAYLRTTERGVTPQMALDTFLDSTW